MQAQGEGPVMNAADFREALKRGEAAVRAGAVYVIDARVDVGAPGEGFKVAMRTLDVFRASVAAAALGMARRALDEALQAHPAAVIATPGGIVSEAATFNVLLAHCYTVWLTAEPDEHMDRVVAQGDLRPMAGNRLHGSP